MRLPKCIHFFIKNSWILNAFLILCILCILLLSVIDSKNANSGNQQGNTSPSVSTPSYIAENDLLVTFAAEHDLPLTSWNRDLVELLERNPDAADYVLNYPLKKYLQPEIDLSQYKDSAQVPLLLQWDERWGYTEYANQLMGLSGCGPTCLSMVCLYLLNDPKYTPRYIADFAKKNGYCSPGNGSTWTLISEGGKKLGLDVVEIPLDTNRIIRNLNVGNPIICVMGPGDFTTTGHFIVLTGYANGKVSVNDPNSPTNSAKLWDLEAIKGQIRNLWVCR